MNEKVRNRIQNATGVHDDLLTMVKKRKLRWYGHISWSSGMAKTILQGTVKGARRRGRQKKRWEDNIKECTGMGFRDSLRAAEDREGWKGIVETSSVVSQWPLRLRDWDERWDEKWLIFLLLTIIANTHKLVLFKHVVLSRWQQFVLITAWCFFSLWTTSHMQISTRGFHG